MGRRFAGDGRDLHGLRSLERPVHLEVVVVRPRALLPVDGDCLDGRLGAARLDLPVVLVAALELERDTLARARDELPRDVPPAVLPGHGVEVARRALWAPFVVVVAAKI